MKKKTEYSRAIAIDAIKRLTERQNAKKEEVFISVKEKRREERERRIKEEKLKNKREKKATIVKDLGLYKIFVPNIYNEKENILLATLNTKKECLKYAKNNNLKITKINF
jgi:hypothetical protein